MSCQFKYDRTFGARFNTERSTPLNTLVASDRHLFFPHHYYFCFCRSVFSQSKLSTDLFKKLTRYFCSDVLEFRVFFCQSGLCYMSLLLLSLLLFIRDRHRTKARFVQKSIEFRYWYSVQDRTLIIMYHLEA